MSTRVVLSATVLVVALTAGAIALLGGDEPAPAPPESSGEGAPAPHESDAASPSIAQMTQRERVQTRHDQPWPYGDFAADIAEMKRPRRREIVYERDQIELRLGTALSERKVTIRLENATPADVIAQLTRQFADDDLAVYTRDPPVENDPVFEHFYMTDVSVWDVIESMRVRTNDLVTYAITPVGLCIGSKKACQNARIDATLWEQQQVGKGSPDDAFDFVKGEYRPDFRGAQIGAVVRDIREKTGVEVVVDAELWSSPVTLTWTADPMPVLAALRQIAMKLGGGIFARDGRVFLLGR